MADPLDEIFVEEIELKLPTAKIRLSQKEKEIEELTETIEKITDRLSQREALLEHTEDDRQILLKENNIFKKDLRKLERIDTLETQMSEVRQDIFNVKENSSAYIKAINYWKEKHDALHENQDAILGSSEWKIRGINLPSGM